ncbi:MAG: hypothetical protein WA421_17430 [Nitrososphaeraceae archaeon]
MNLYPPLPKVSKEIHVYTEEDLLKSAEKNIKDLYSELRNVILNLGSEYVQYDPQKHTLHLDVA